MCLSCSILTAVCVASFGILLLKYTLDVIIEYIFTLYIHKIKCVVVSGTYMY